MFLNIDLDNAQKTEACLVDSPRSIKDFITGKNKVFLIGEAAGFISPSSFEGISFAMKSGQLLAEAFKENNVDKIGDRYRKLTRLIRIRLLLKMIKRLVMYTPITRFLIMKSGITSLKINKDYIR